MFLLQYIGLVEAYKRIADIVVHYIVNCAIFYIASAESTIKICPKICHFKNVGLNV